MPATIERLIRGSNNLITLTLTEGGVPITDLQLAQTIEIEIGPYLTISRTAPPTNQGGVDWSQGNGLLVINPGLLTEDLDSIPAQWIPARIIIKDGTNVQGVYFGGADSDPRLMFSVR